PRDAERAVSRDPLGRLLVCRHRRTSILGRQPRSALSGRGSPVDELPPRDTRFEHPARSRGGREVRRSTGGGDTRNIPPWGYRVLTGSATVRLPGSNSRGRKVAGTYGR